MKTIEQQRIDREKQIEYQRRMQKRKKQQRIALLILIGIVLAIFGLGVLFGWHLGTVHAVQKLPTQTETKAHAATPMHTAEAKIKPTLVVDETRPVIESEGNTLSPELQSVMADMCTRYSVPYALALAVAEQESRFNPDAQSRTDDYGLMQINAVNFEWLREKGIDPLTYEGNIEAGVLMLSKALDRYGETELALMAYNCGDTGAQRLWDAGVYSTQYSNSVIERYQKWVQVLEGV